MKSQAKTLLIDMIQMAADQACEAINAGDYVQGIAQWNECARLTQQLQLEAGLKKSRQMEESGRLGEASLPLIDIS